MKKDEIFYIIRQGGRDWDAC